MGLGTKATPMWRWVLEIHKKEPVLRSSCLLQVMPWWHVKVQVHIKSDMSQLSTRWSLTRTSKRQRLLKATGTQSSRNSLALSLFRWGKILSSIFDQRKFSKLNPMGNEVFFEVWDKDRLSKDDLMGKVVALLIWKSILSLGRKCYIKTQLQQILQVKIINAIHWKQMLQASILLNPQLLSVADSGAFLCLPLSKK